MFLGPETRNPNIEIRNKFELPKDGNYKIRFRFGHCSSIRAFDHCFELRYSNFDFGAKAVQLPGEVRSQVQPATAGRLWERGQ